jgi:hypothetical protein
MRWTLGTAVLIGFVLAMALVFGGNILNRPAVAPTAQIPRTGWPALPN